MSADANKEVVTRFVAEVMNRGEIDRVADVFTPSAANRARAWITPFLRSFDDVEMRAVELVAEGDVVVGRFACSGTHARGWRGHDVTGRRFTDVAEVYFFRLADGRIDQLWGLEDTWDRMRQLGLVSD